MLKEKEIAKWREKLNPYIQEVKLKLAKEELKKKEITGVNKMLSVKEINLLQAQNEALIKQNWELQQEHNELLHCLSEMTDQCNGYKKALCKIKTVAEKVITDIDEYNNTAYSADAVVALLKKIIGIMEGK